MSVKFISYTGSYPTLCTGHLTIEVNGKRYVLNQVISPDEKATCYYDHKTRDIVHAYGGWKVNADRLSEELRQFACEIQELANANIEPPCCGGCE